MDSFEDRILGNEFTNKMTLTEHTREVCRAEDARLYNLFRDAALKEVGLENYKLKNRVFDKAWSDGHASGHMEVYHHLIELAELINE